MARARNIKPGFFKNEILGVADPLYSLLFEGLWVLADRAGRLEDRPLRIKGEVFPYREGMDMDAMLNWLQSNGFIQRYTANGKKCILVLEFVKHQNPHKNETESELPAPDLELTDSEIIGKTSEIIGSTRADSLSTDSLSTDSLISLSDSANPTDTVDQKSDSEKPVPKNTAIPPCPFADLIDAYEAALPNLPSVTRSLFRDGVNGKATAQRWAWVMAETHEKGKKKGERLAVTQQEGIDWFTRFFAYAAGSDFLTGANGKFTGCSMGWLVTKANFEKVLAGNYHMEKAA